MRTCWVVLALAATPAHAEPYLEGDHATGTWGGKRDALEEHGLSIDLVYTVELFANVGDGSTALGHVDAALTLETEKAGLWPGGTFYILGQNGHGDGINTEVGSVTPISNVEAEPFTQLTELFYEQSIGDDALVVRAGKQDANRDFGTPRFAGNFINGTLGMFPNMPLPSFPTTGLGIYAAAKPADWLAVKAGIYEGSPESGGFGLDTAFQDDAGYVAIAGPGITHRYGPERRHEGTSSAGVWHKGGDVVANDGFFVQNDEHIFAHPDDPKDNAGLTLILRYSYARPERSAVSHYVGGSASWYGLGFTHDDTVGIAAGYLVLEPTGSEWFVDVTYKLRLTHFFSLQPDIEFYRHPAGTADDAFLVGGRIKIKL
jgi:porin